MTSIAVAGAGAFGTALAIALAAGGHDVALWARNPASAAGMQQARRNSAYLPEVRFPDRLSVTADRQALGTSPIVLIVVPTQELRAFLIAQSDLLANKTLVLCCKGIERGTGLLPSQVVDDILPGAKVAILTGPGFADEIAAGQPTALTLAMIGPEGETLQKTLSTPTVRLYLSSDPVGAEIGGAMKNVVAIACGIAIGAGLGESARAAVMTRGYAEIQRLAVELGAQPATLVGLSGLGDLALTCTSGHSRNFSLGLAFGQGGGMSGGKTYEGAATAHAVLVLAAAHGIEMPLSGIVAAALDKKITIEQAISALMSRPLKSE